MKKLYPAIIASICLLLITLNQANAQAYKTSFTVAQDGTGDYKTIQAAVDGCKSFPDAPTEITIHIKKGVYNEKIIVGSWNTRLSLIGDSKDSTIITFGDFFTKLNRGPNSTFLTATLNVQANDFTAKNLTIVNSAGAVGQALAMSCTGTRCYFENCAFIGNQDTLYAAGEGAFQYYKNCYIEGTVDFIFGEATAVFEGCTTKSKSNNGSVTAGSTSQYSAYGYVFKNCNITTAPNVTKALLGRPWRQYAKTVFIDCKMDAAIFPEGWGKWAGPTSGPLAFYAEYNSTGEGANPTKRVPWAKQLTAKEAKEYTLKNIFKSNVPWSVVQ